MLQTLTLADRAGVDVTLHETATRCLTGATGLVGITAVRESKRLRPTAHGVIDEAHWTEGKMIQLAGECWGPSIELAFAEFRAIAKPMLETLDTGPALMKWTEGITGNQLQSLVKLAGPVEPPLQESGAVLTWDAVFTAEDPRAYSQVQGTATGGTLSATGGGLVMPFTFPFAFTPSGGGLAPIELAGNRPSPPIFRIYGFCSAPRLKLLGDTREIVLTGEIGAGEFMELDVARRTVKLNGSTNRVNLLDFAATNWFEIPPGPQTVQLLATNFDVNARVDVIARSAFA